VGCIASMDTLEEIWTLLTIEWYFSCLPVEESLCQLSSPSSFSYVTRDKEL